MSNLMLKASVNAKVWANTSVQRMKARADQGQGAVEYLGIIVVVVAIIGVLMTTNFGNAISTAITAQITKVTGGGGK
uniref:Flp family type IVb pilin n=1 Tax=Streptomyces sp. NBC_01401 TaxID=2903854 RepID=A0AAU3GRI2_9ACTN